MVAQDYPLTAGGTARHRRLDLWRMIGDLPRDPATPIIIIIIPPPPKREELPLVRRPPLQHSPPPKLPPPASGMTDRSRGSSGCTSPTMTTKCPIKSRQMGTVEAGSKTFTTVGPLLTRNLLVDDRAHLEYGRHHPQAETEEGPRKLGWRIKEDLTRTTIHPRLPIIRKHCRRCSHNNHLRTNICLRWVSMGVIIAETFTRRPRETSTLKKTMIRKPRRAKSQGVLVVEIARNGT